jgi:hypothetical protein
MSETIVKKRKPFKKAIIVLAIAIPLSMMGGVAARAFSISGILGNVAQIFGVDISTELQYISMAENLIHSATSEDYGGLAEDLTGAIAGMGRPDPTKIRDKVAQDAAESSSETGETLSNATFHSQMDMEETLGNAQTDAALGDKGQEALVNKGNATVSIVKGVGDMAEQCNSSSISLEVDKCIMHQNTGIASAVGQVSSELRQHTVQNSEQTAVLQQIRNDIYQQNRIQIANNKRRNKWAASSAGSFGGILKGWNPSDYQSGGSQSYQSNTSGS